MQPGATVPSVVARWRVCIVLVALLLTPTVRSEDRVAEARQAKLAGLQRDFRRAGLAWPPKGVFFRAIKAEGVLEAWVGKLPGPLTLFRTYPIAAMSGSLGPKRRFGDLQVPEGFYRIDRFNPRSRFLLSLGINYPNERDLSQGEARPGGDIFIHGNQVSIGCLAMTDDVIQEIYLLALDSIHRPIPVHLFPMRMRGPEYWQAFARAPRDVQELWRSMHGKFLQFERTRKVPAVRTVNGQYR